MPRLTRREFLKLSGQALAATGAASLTCGLTAPTPAQADTPVELDGRETVARVGDTFATITLVPRFTKSDTPEVILAKVRYGTDPTLASYSETPQVSASYFTWIEGDRHSGPDGSDQLVTSRKCRFVKKPWDIVAGDEIKNKNDGSVMVVSSIVDDHTIAGTLSGGTRNTWNQGDKWQIVRTYYSLEIKLTGLAPNAKHYYRVVLKQGSGSWQTPGEIHSFQTRRPPGQSFTFAVWADAHRRVKRGWPEWDAMMASIHADQPDFVIDVGDTWANGNGQGKPHSKYFPPNYTQFRMVRNGLTGHLGMSAVAADCPYYFARGNHEGLSDYDPASRHDLLVRLLTLFIPNPDGNTYPQGGSHDADYDQGYFAFEWGDALFVAVDSIKYKTYYKTLQSPDRFHIGQAQLTWLTNLLQNSTARWKFLFMHHTFGGGNDYGRGGATFAFEHEQAQVQSLCEQHGAHIFYGHDHLLAQGVANGVLYYEAGSCGGLNRYKDKEYLYPEGYESPCTDGVCDYLGYLLVEVTPTLITLRYKNYRGEVMDVMTLT